MVEMVKQAMFAAIQTIYVQGNKNLRKSGADLICVTNEADLLRGLKQAKKSIKLYPCADVSTQKLHLIDPGEDFSTTREIMSVCKFMLTMKAPHGQRVWGIAITPKIEKMIVNKTHILIEEYMLHLRYVADSFKIFGISKMEFCYFTSMLVASALQVLPNTTQELKRIYRQIWARSSDDKLFKKKMTESQNHSFHKKCLSDIENEMENLPLSTFSWLEPSFWTELQRMHWKPVELQDFCVTSKAQRAAYRAFLQLKEMFHGRKEGECQQVEDAIRSIISDVELTNHWMHLINSELTNFQQITCHDWCRLEGIDQKKGVRLVHALSQYIRGSNEIRIRLAYLRLLLPLIEPWVLCILLERKLRKDTISQYMSAGLKELEGFVKYAHPDLSTTFIKLRQFSRPYGEEANNG